MQFVPYTTVDPYASVVSCSSVSWFWLSWLNGELVFGLGKIVGQNYFLDYVDPTPINISYMAIAGSSGSVSAEWIIPAELYTNSMD